MSDIIVNSTNLDLVAETLAKTGTRAFDTETTGLNLHGEDKMFSLIICDGVNGYYFDLATLGECASYLNRIFCNVDSKWFAHNAKFDMRALEGAGVLFFGEVHCTATFARLITNNELTYTLDACAKRIGLNKDKGVEEYISEHHLWEWMSQPGKKTRRKKKFFDKVPFDIITKYGFQDARICYELGKHQETCMAHDVQYAHKDHDIAKLHREEAKFTRILYHMEQVGVRVDLSYVREAADKLARENSILHEELSKLVGESFVDSNKSLTKYFATFGVSSGYTEKGNPSFTDEILGDIKHPLAVKVREYRGKLKLLSTYYIALLELNKDGVIHTEFRQAGTATSRLSSAGPNLQNLPKEDTSVRKAFIPRDGFVLVSIDYSQLEYRVMLDRAGEMGLIEKVKNGMDVHEATAEMLGIIRKQAKCINFAILYGSGTVRLAQMLELSIGEAARIKDQYFSTLPQVKSFIQRVIFRAKTSRVVKNWAGRQYQFPNSEFAYKAPNYLIQGGCADIVKRAMNTLSDYLLCKRSRMLIQVHDEVVFEVHETELAIIPTLKKIMETAYPYKYLPLECKVAWSRKSWGDLEDYGKEAGDSFQGAGFVLT